jgi:hypothetical protein
MKLDKGLHYDSHTFSKYLFLSKMHTVIKRGKRKTDIRQTCFYQVFGICLPWGKQLLGIKIFILSQTIAGGQMFCRKRNIIPSFYFFSLENVIQL